jgi:hypothetical protein
LSLHIEHEISDYKKQSAKEITKNLIDKHKPHVVKQADEIRELFEQMFNPLFVQARIEDFIGSIGFNNSAMK